MSNLHHKRIGRGIAATFRQARRRHTSHLHHPVTSRTVIAGLMVSAGLVALGAPTPLSAAPAEKVTICHATGSTTNPYVRITISENAVEAHRGHQGGLDIIPAPDRCPGDPVPPPGTDVCPNLPGDQPVVPDLFVVDDQGNCVPAPDVLFVPCVVSAGVTQTATTVTGTPGDDTIDCTNASPGKTIDTFAGNDTVTGTAFDDTVTGGAGNDTITGLGGDDVLIGNEGNDTITGGEGNDVITGGAGNDTLSGSAGNDSVDGGLGIDTVTGGEGDDTLVGPPNDASVDTVSGGTGTDTCTGPGPDGDIVTGCEVITP